MANIVRVAAIGGIAGVIVAGGLAMPAFLQNAVAEEPTKVAAAFSDFFPHQPYDPSTLLKFDVIVGPGVSTDVQRSTTVSKIGYGNRTYVTIITTSTGTYSSDALTSPNVKYPGVDLLPRFASRWGQDDHGLGGAWTSTTSGSITTFSFVPAHSLQS